MSRAWKEQGERSTRLALVIIRWVALRLGRAPGRVLLYPIVAYYFLTSRAQVSASRQYLSRILERPATTGDVLKHIHCFAATILDRVFFLTGRNHYFDVKPVNAGPLLETVSKGEGALLMVSHLGSFEALRAMGVKNEGLPVRIVMNRKQNQTITTMLEALSPGISETVIDTGVDNTLTLLKIKEAIDEGCLIGLMADRVHSEHERTCECEFLGHKVTLPITPVMVAAAIGAPVYLCFGIYHGGNEYELHFENFADKITVSRPNRQAELSALMQSYADRLEHHAKRAPYNWFNFYDYWNIEDNPQLKQRR